MESFSEEVTVEQNEQNVLISRETHSGFREQPMQHMRVFSVFQGGRWERAE